MRKGFKKNTIRLKKINKSLKLLCGSNHLNEFKKEACEKLKEIYGKGGEIETNRKTRKINSKNAFKKIMNRGKDGLKYTKNLCK